MGRYIILRMYRQSPDGRARWGCPMADRHEDDDVIVRAKSGDESAWRELYEAHAGRLQAWLRSRPSGDSAEDSDDVAATSWLTAADKIADFHGSTDDFGVGSSSLSVTPHSINAAGRSGVPRRRSKSTATTRAYGVPTTTAPFSSMTWTGLGDCSPNCHRGRPRSSLWSTSLASTRQPRRQSSASHIRRFA